LGGAALEAGKNYKITVTYNGSFTFWGSSNVKLYIQGTWNMPSDFQIQTGLEIIVMSGAKILANKNASFVGSSSLTIMPNGVVELKSLTFSNHEGHLKNWGTITLDGKLSMPSNASFFNTGEVTAKDLDVNGVTLTNKGKMIFDQISSVNNSTFI